MARPKSEGETKSHQQHLLMAPSEVEAVDNWGFANRIRSRGEAIRRLCQLGLAVSERKDAWEELEAKRKQAIERLKNELATEQSDDLVDNYIEALELLAEAGSNAMSELRYLLMTSQLLEDSEGAIAERAHNLREMFAEYKRHHIGKKD